LAIVSEQRPSEMNVNKLLLGVASLLLSQAMVLKQQYSETEQNNLLLLIN